MLALSDALPLALSFDCSPPGLLSAFSSSAYLQPRIQPSSELWVLLRLHPAGGRSGQALKAQGWLLPLEKLADPGVSCIHKWEDSALLGSPPFPGERLADLLELQAPVQTSTVQQCFYLPNSYRTVLPSPPSSINEFSSPKSFCSPPPNTRSGLSHQYPIILVPVSVLGLLWL